MISLRFKFADAGRRGRAGEGVIEMMHDMMNPDMRWGMGALGLLGVIILLLIIAALVKYVFFR